MKILDIARPWPCQIYKFTDDRSKCSLPPGGAFAAIQEEYEYGNENDMGTTDNMLDDVLVFADPYDTSDHCQDGYYTISFERYVSQWFDHQVMAESEKNQQYVAVTK